MLPAGKKVPKLIAFDLLLDRDGLKF